MSEFVGSVVSTACKTGKHHLCTGRWVGSRCACPTCEHRERTRATMAETRAECLPYIFRLLESENGLEVNMVWDAMGGPLALARHGRNIGAVMNMVHHEYLTKEVIAWSPPYSRYGVRKRVPVMKSRLYKGDRSDRDWVLSREGYLLPEDYHP